MTEPARSEEVPRLETERLVLDPVRESDSEAVFEFCQDPEVQRWVPIPVPYTREHAQSFVTDYARAARAARHPSAESFLLWAIRVDDALAGVIELRLEPLRSSTVGFWLGRPWRRGRRMDEALAAVIDYAFTPDGLDLERIHWEAVAGNIPSATIARRAGFRFEGTARRAMIHRGARVDSWQATLLRADPRSRASGWPM